MRNPEGIVIKYNPSGLRVAFSYFMFLHIGDPSGVIFNKAF